MKVRSHLLFSEFSLVKLRNFNRNPSDWEFCVRMKVFPADFAMDSGWSRGVATLTNRKLLIFQKMSIV